VLDDVRIVVKESKYAGQRTPICTQDETFSRGRASSRRAVALELDKRQADGEAASFAECTSTVTARCAGRRLCLTMPSEARAAELAATGAIDSIKTVRRREAGVPPRCRWPESWTALSAIFGFVRARLRYRRLPTSHVLDGVSRGLMTACSRSGGVAVNVESSPPSDGHVEILLCALGAQRRQPLNNGAYEDRFGERRRPLPRVPGWPKREDVVHQGQQTSGLAAIMSRNRAIFSGSLGAVIEQRSAIALIDVTASGFRERRCHEIAPRALRARTRYVVEDEHAPMTRRGRRAIGGRDREAGLLSDRHDALRFEAGARTGFGLTHSWSLGLRTTSWILFPRAISGDVPKRAAAAR